MEILVAAATLLALVLSVIKFVLDQRHRRREEAIRHREALRDTLVIACCVVFTALLWAHTRSG